MSEVSTRECPHCFTPLETTEELLAQADGMVRCGSCLRVFNAYSGEGEFVSPVVSEEPPEDPLAGIAIEAMSAAELPAQAKPVPRGVFTLFVLLLIALGAQLGWNTLHPPAMDSITLERLVVRPRTGEPPGLRVDAILQNHSSIEQPLPRLFLSFTNQYGEQQAWRSFTPDEYLHGHWSDSAVIPPHTTLQVSLSLRDPGRRAVGYDAWLQFALPPAN